VSTIGHSFPVDRCFFALPTPGGLDEKAEEKPGSAAEMKVLVTGAAGFIGSNLVEHLLREGHSVTGLDNLSGRYPLPPRVSDMKEMLRRSGGDFFQGDIRDPESVGRILSDADPDAVIHLAARVGARRSTADPLPYYRENILGTQYILHASLTSGVRHLVMASTGSVYGNRQGEEPLNEDRTPPDPQNPYSLTKLVAERMLGFVDARRINLTALRIFTTYGPRLRPDMGIARFFSHIWQGRPVEIFDTPRSVRDYLYIDDCVRGITRTLGLKPGYRILNLGSGQATTPVTLVNRIAQLVKKPVTIKWIPSPAGDYTGGIADLKKAREVVKYNPQISLSDGLQKYWEWVQKYMSGAADEPG
jgi:UDP-glucuronate 4-epimerase